MSNPYERTTPAELELFLDDVGKNAPVDENTDYQKLILYLFGFLNSKLTHNDNLHLLNRLVDSIDLVLRKRTHLLNAAISPNEISTVASLDPSRVLMADFDHFYQWIIHFALHWLPQFPHCLQTTNAVKRLMFAVINAVCGHISRHNHKWHLRSLLMGELNSDMDRLFRSCSLNLLSKTTHLFTVVHDYDILHKLLLNSSGCLLAFDAIAKKIHYLLHSQKETGDCQDNLKSVFILNMCSNIMLQHEIKWSLFTLLLKWIHQHLESFQSQQKLLDTPLLQYTHSCCICLLRIYLLCRKASLLHNFFGLFDLHPFLSMDVSGCPPLLGKTLHILIHQWSTLYSTSTSPTAYFLATVPFEEIDLQHLRQEILQETHMDELLEFITDRALGLDELFPQVSTWLEYVSKYLQTSTPSQESLYTMVTALGKVPFMLSSDKNLRSSLKNIYSDVSPSRKLIPEHADASFLYSDIICLRLILNAQLLNTDPLLTLNLLLSIFNLFACFRPNISSIDNDVCFNFLLQCLQKNTNRDVRLAAARVIPLYLIQEDESREYVFKNAFRLIAEIKIQEKVYLAESTFMALSEIALVCEGEWLCAIFIKMIDSFGEANEQHVNIVYNCLLYVAAAKSLTPYKLLLPYLSSIAERIIKNPRVFSRVTSLLGVSKKFFLSQTREYTTPRLLEYYKHDYIQEIASASNMDKVKLLAKTLPRIMAFYLCKDDLIDPTYIVKVLGNASHQYSDLSITDLIPNVGEVLWFTLLQIQLSDDGQVLNSGRIFPAIKYIAKIDMAKKSGEVRTDDPQFDYIKYILGEHVLELVQRFSENVHHIKGIKPFLEKVNSLNAIFFLIDRNIDAAASALGQISTCLQASLDNQTLEIPAISCWNLLVQNLGLQHLVSLFDITISLIFQRFEHLQLRSKQIAVKILEKLFLELREKYRRYALYYFSVPFIRDLDKFFILDATFINMMKPQSKLSYFPEFTRRLQTNHKYVVHQALDDLLIFTSKYQLSCQSDDFRDAANEAALSLLVRTLLDISVQFKNKEPEISTKCARVLACIGALDSNKFCFKTISSSVVVLYDFRDYKENAKFLRTFIEEKVIKNFWASNNPIKQLFSAYSMQRFLNVLGLDNSVLHCSTQDIRYEVWNSFSEMNKSTLIPLLSSKYFAPEPRYEPLPFPFYRLGMKYEKWLVDVTTNLLRRPYRQQLSHEHSDNRVRHVIFQTCSLLIRDEEVSISQYLLKFVALSHVVNNDEQAGQDILQEFLNILKMDAGTHMSSSSDRVEQLKLCYQAVFEVIDYFNEWVSAATHRLSESSILKSDSSFLKRSRQSVISFLNEIPMELMALTSSECDSYERTILYLEKCYREGKVKKNNKLDNLSITSTLQSVYSSIDDFDALDGILKKFSTSNLAEKLDTFQYNENWSIAQESFQVLGNLGSESDRVECTTKLFRSLAHHGLYDQVLLSLDSKIKTRSIQNYPIPWTMVGLEAAVAAGDFEKIQKWSMISEMLGKSTDLESVINSTYAKGLLSLNEKRYLSFDESIDDSFKLIGQSLSSSRSSSFSRNSSLMVQLHILYDTTSLVRNVADGVLFEETELILKERLKNTDLTFDSQWKILNMHKAVSLATDVTGKIAEILLQCSAIARKNDRLDIATKSIINAMALNDKEANVEYSHLLWDQGKQTEAIKTLAEYLQLQESPLKRGDNRRRSQNQLQYAIWLDESSHTSSGTIIAEYTKAYKADPSWDKPYYDLGKYYSKVMESREDSSGMFEQQIIRLFLKALGLGSTYIFEALPKFITIWLDFAQKTKRTRDAERRLQQIIHDIQTYKSTVPVYVWYTSITQILSRITHHHQASADIMMFIVESLMKVYPKHSLWYVLSHVKSKDKARRQRVLRILENARKDKTFAAITSNSQELFDILESIAARKIKRNPKKRWTLTEDFEISNLQKRYDSMVIPVKSNLEIKIPAHRHTTKLGSAFPKSASITFDGFDEEAKVFNSLQLPKQITIRGTDGKPYRLMLKRDDTRKDAKVFEFSNMINRLLAANNDARKRNLVIENYSVIPLAEDMGIIEFVQDVTTMKAVYQEQQKKLGKIANDRKIFMKLDEAQKLVKSKYASDENSLAALVELFDSICLEFPPVLHHWFIDQFSEPAIWYLARKSYTRTAAVMSMVGYIIGLGDRHCENILFFKRSGSSLHIDFDCLFEKGLTLPTPEIVPFRLTQNMVDAMGISGIEGIFRITCEVTGQILRDNEASLMNILETLIYDPLLDWRTQDNPQDHLRRVRRKIRGLLDEKEGLPMNIHGQVDVLIQEATSKENLSQMYGGWAPYV